MSPTEPSSAEVLVRDIKEGDAPRVTPGETNTATPEELSRISAISDCVIEGTAAIDNRRLTKPRAKHLQYQRFAGQPYGGITDGSVSSAVGGGEGIGGEGGSSGGGKPKDDPIDINLLIQEARKTIDETAEKTSEVTPPPKSSPEKRHSSRPSPEDAEKALAEELADYAAEKNLKFIDIDKSSYMPALEEFRKFKWNPGRIMAINELKDHLEKERRRLKFFLDSLELASQKHSERIVSVRECTPAFLGNSLDTFEDDVEAAYMLLLKGTRERFMAGGTFDRLTHMKSSVIETICAPDLFERMKVITEDLLGNYRYTIEALRETYRSRSLTPGSIMQLGGFKDKTDVFYTGSGPTRRFRRHLDMGMGCGEILIQLANEMIEVEKKELKNSERATILRDMFDQFYNQPKDDRDWNDYSRNMERRTDEAVERKFNRKKFAKDLKRNIVGIDQSAPFVARLASKGIGAVQGDICVRPRKLKSTTGIEAGSVDVLYSTLTFDRAKSKNNLALNISRALHKDGVAILGLKGDFTMTNDGHGGKEDPINYGTPGDWDLESVSASEMLDKLIPRLVKCGLQPTGLAMHKSLVISTDCITDSSNPNCGPQEYNLVMLVCKKLF